MAKKFNPQLNEDINMLKGIRRTDYPEEYKRAFGNIMKRHGISRSTVYSELEKAVPGEYKTYPTTGRHILINENEVNSIEELLKEGKSIRYISKYMSLELGFRYTPYRIYRVKEIIKNGTGVFPVLEGVPDEESAKLFEERITPVQKKPDEPVEFKGNISLFFSRLSMLSFIDPERKLKIKIAGNTYECSTGVLKDCFLHISRSASAGGASIPDAFRFDMETMLIEEFDKIKQQIAAVFFGGIFGVFLKKRLNNLLGAFSSCKPFFTRLNK